MNGPLTDADWAPFVDDMDEWARITWPLALEAWALIDEVPTTDERPAQPEG